MSDLRNWGRSQIISICCLIEFLLLLSDYDKIVFNIVPAK